MEFQRYRTFHSNAHVFYNYPSYSRNIILVQQLCKWIVRFQQLRVHVCGSRNYFARLPGQLSKSTWQIVFIYIHVHVPSNAIGAANREVTRTLQACKPKLRHSNKRGAHRKCSAVKRKTFQEFVLCFTSRKLIYHDADKISIVNVDMVLLAPKMNQIQFIFDAWDPYFLHKNSPDTTVKNFLAAGKFH